MGLRVDPDPERERLRRLTWAALEREAIEAGVSLGMIRRARTREELWEAILQAGGCQVIRRGANPR